MPGRLRGELTEFVGRRAELALVRQALGRARLVTLTGPGGSVRPGWRCRRWPPAARSSPSAGDRHHYRMTGSRGAGPRGTAGHQPGCPGPALDRAPAPGAAGAGPML